MTDQSPIEKRDALRARIEAAERRNAERNLADQAREAASAAIDYTRANPLTVVGGAVALGLVIGLLTRPGRRVAERALHGAGDALSGAAASAKSGVRSVTGRSPSRLGTMISEAVMAYAMTLIDEVLDAAREGKERAGDLGEKVADEARQLSSSTAQTADSAVQGTRALADKAREAALGAVRDFRARTKV